MLASRIPCHIVMQVSEDLLKVLYWLAIESFPAQIVDGQVRQFLVEYFFIELRLEGPWTWPEIREVILRSLC